MRKCYLFLMMLFVQLITCGHVFAADPPQAEYDAAMAAIENGAYYLTAEVEGVKYYLSVNGGDASLVPEDDAYAEDRTLFTITKESGGALYDVGLNIDPGNGYHFSNTTLSDSKAVLNYGHLRLDNGNNRTDWERQVPYMNEEGKLAIRSCNTAFGESSWADAGRAFWTYEVEKIEEEEAPVYDEYDAPVLGYSYEPSYIWSLEKPGANEQLYGALNDCNTKFEYLIWMDKDDPYDEDNKEGLNMGTGFGQYPDWDSWYTLWDKLQEMYAWFENFESYYPYDWLGEEEDKPTLEQVKALVAEIEDLYQKILDSEVPYTMQDGYYRIYAVKRFKSGTGDDAVLVDKGFAASYDKANHENKGVYGTVDKGLANYVWKLTKSEAGDSVMIQNVGMETYISFSSPSANRVVMTKDVTDASYVQFDYAGNNYVEPDGVGDNRDLFAIRLASSKRESGSYFHQNNHGSVEDESSPWGAYETDRGTEQELTFWNTTRDFEDTAKDKWTSEWFLEPVSEEEVAELLEAFGPIVDHDLLVRKNQELRDKVAETLELAKDKIRTKMITDASQLTSPYSDSSEGQHLEYLIDNDGSTFWHTTWHGLGDAEAFYYYGEGYEGGLECHYLQISGMNNMTGNCELYLRERASADNDRVKTLVIMGTDNLKNEDDEWDEIARITLPNTAAGDENTVPFTMTESYPYIRVFTIETASSSYAFRQFWHAAEIQFYTVEDNPNSQFVQMGQVAQDLQDEYDANCAVPDDQITIDIYNALKAAYDAFLSSGLVDPAELRAALQTYAKATEGVVEGTNPGQWIDTGIADSYNNLYAEIDAYNKAGKYDAAEIHKYAVMLKAMQKSVMEKANVVETDKWYQITFPTEEMYDRYGFSKDGGDNCNDLAWEDQKTMWGTIVASGVLVSETGTEINEETGETVEKTYTHLENLAPEDVRESNRLFFFNENEIQDPSSSMFRFVEKEAEGVDYAPIFQDAKENMSMALDMSTTFTRVDTLITSAAQFSSNNDIDYDGQRLSSGCLIDGKQDTYWHTDYRQQVLEIPYLQVALNEPVSGLIQVDITRRSSASNGHVVRMYIQGSTDAQTWTNVGYLETPFASVTETVTSQPVDLGGTFSHLRFILTYRYGTDGGGNMEFDPFAEINGAEDWNKKWTYFHMAEFQIYSIVPNTELSAEGKALQEAYTAANKIVLKDVTAEDLAAIAGAYRAYREKFNSAEGKEVLPYGKDKADPVYAIQNKATGLFIFANDGKGGNTNDMYLKTIPTFFDYKAIGYERSLMHGYNINGSNPNNMHGGESNRRLCTWGSTEPQSNSGLVLIEAAEEYEAPESFTFFKDIKPGRIIDWCNSVTITPVDAPNNAFAYAAVGQYTLGEGENAETFLAVKAIESIPAGDPALYIFSDTLSYDADDDYTEPIKFTIPGNEKPVVEGAKVNGLVGTLVPVTLDKCEIYFNANYVAAPQKDENIGLTACSAYLDLDNCPEIDPTVTEAYDFSIFLGGAADEVAVGVKDISSALEKISQPGNVYSVDGKLLRSGATLNSLKALGTGTYILNGVKVYVK